MTSFWYKFYDLTSSCGTNDCGFWVVISKSYIEEMRNRIDKNVIGEDIREIRQADGAAANLTLTMDEENPNLLQSVSGVGFGIDRIYSTMGIPHDTEKEIAYCTHNCHSPNSRHTLEQAFLGWTKLVEAYH